MRGFSEALLAQEEQEGEGEGRTELGGAEFTAVVWCALDPREKGTVEAGKMVAFLRSVAALATEGGGVMRAQALHRRLLEAFRLHAGGGGVQVMSELGRSKYNTGQSSKAVHSFAYKEDSGPVQSSWEALTGVSSVSEKGQKLKVRSVAVVAFQMTDAPSGLGNDWCEVLGIACVLLNVATGLAVDEFHTSVRPSNPKPLSALAQATACAQQLSIDAAPSLSQVLASFREWLQLRNVLDGDLPHKSNPTAWVTLGDAPLGSILPRQCHAAGMAFPKWLGHWNDLAILFSRAHTCGSCSGCATRVPGQCLAVFDLPGMLAMIDRATDHDHDDDDLEEFGWEDNQDLELRIYNTGADEQLGRASSNADAGAGRVLASGRLYMLTDDSATQAANQKQKMTGTAAIRKALMVQRLMGVQLRNQVETGALEDKDDGPTDVFWDWRSKFFSCDSNDLWFSTRARERGAGGASLQHKVLDMRKIVSVHRSTFAAQEFGMVISLVVNGGHVTVTLAAETAADRERWMEGVAAGRATFGGGGAVVREVLSMGVECRHASKSPSTLRLQDGPLRREWLRREGRKGDVDAARANNEAFLAYLAAGLDENLSATMADGVLAEEEETARLLMSLGIDSATAKVCSTGRSEAMEIQGGHHPPLGNAMWEAQDAAEVVKHLLQKTSEKFLPTGGYSWLTPAIRFQEIRREVIPTERRLEKDKSMLFKKANMVKTTISTFAGHRRASVSSNIDPNHVSLFSTGDET